MNQLTNNAHNEFGTESTKFNPIEWNSLMYVARLTRQCGVTVLRLKFVNWSAERFECGQLSQITNPLSHSVFSWRRVSWRSTTLLLLCLRRSLMRFDNDFIVYIPKLLHVDDVFPPIAFNFTFETLRFGMSMSFVRIAHYVYDIQRMLFEYYRKCGNDKHNIDLTYLFVRSRHKSATISHAPHQVPALRHELLWTVPACLLFTFSDQLICHRTTYLLSQMSQSHSCIRSLCLNRTV